MPQKIIIKKLNNKNYLEKTTLVVAYESFLAFNFDDDIDKLRELGLSMRNLSGKNAINKLVFVDHFGNYDPVEISLD